MERELHAHALPVVTVIQRGTTVNGLGLEPGAIEGHDVIAIRQLQRRDLAGERFSA